VEEPYILSMLYATSLEVKTAADGEIVAEEEYQLSKPALRGISLLV
jgi:hypothetical protein